MSGKCGCVVKAYDLSRLVNIVLGGKDESLACIAFECLLMVGLRKKRAFVDGTCNVTGYLEIVICGLMNNSRYFCWSRRPRAVVILVVLIAIGANLTVQNILQLEVTGGVELAEVSLQGDRSWWNGIGRHDGRVSIAWGLELGCCVIKCGREEEEMEKPKAAPDLVAEGGERRNV